MYKDKSRRHEFMEHGILEQITAKLIEVSQFDKDSYIKMRIRHLAPTTTLPDIWQLSCKVSERFTFTG
jgi:hypothetical protein